MTKKDAIIIAAIIVISVIFGSVATVAVYHKFCFQEVAEDVVEIKDSMKESRDDIVEIKRYIEEENEPFFSKVAKFFKNLEPVSDEDICNIMGGKEECQDDFFE